jgi:hydrogenase/urease accessory protein HupE
MEVIIANKVVILGVLLALSEALALIPQVNANSVFQLVVNVLKKVKEVVVK